MKYSETYNRISSKLVLVDKINNISNKIHRDTLKGGADTIRMNISTYFKHIEPILSTLNNRYSIFCSEQTEPNLVIVEFSDDPKFSGEIKII